MRSSFGPAEAFTATTSDNIKNTTTTVFFMEFSCSGILRLITDRGLVDAIVAFLHRSQVVK
jgi:hypothetical protein